MHEYFVSFLEEKKEFLSFLTDPWSLPSVRIDSGDRRYFKGRDTSATEMSQDEDSQASRPYFPQAKAKKAGLKKPSDRPRTASMSSEEGEDLTFLTGDLSTSLEAKKLVDEHMMQYEAESEEEEESQAGPTWMLEKQRQLKKEEQIREKQRIQMEKEEREREEQEARDRQQEEERRRREEEEEKRRAAAEEKRQMELEAKKKKQEKEEEARRKKEEEEKKKKLQCMYP